jgi:hypothetical protein
MVDLLFDDVLTNIFLHLGTAADVVAAGRVCKRWNMNSQSDNIWENLFYSEWDPWRIYESGISNYTFYI